MVSLGPLILFNAPTLGGVAIPSGPNVDPLSGEPLAWDAWGMGSTGISLLIPESPEITTSGGAGDVLSETGDRRGVVG